MTISAYESNLVTTSTTASAMSSLSGNEDTFLKMLTTQLQNQDPTNPTDTSQFTQQLVEYSQVEQQIQGNQKLDAMTKLLGNAQVQSALNMVGGEVEFAGNSFNYNGSGNYTVNYSLPSQAAQTTINVQDGNGNTVFTTAGNTAAGNDSFVWSGLQNDGTTAPPGNYTVNVAAQDANGNSITPTVSVWGQVTGVQATGTDILLMLNGGNSISLSNVSNIQSAQAYQNSQTTTSN